MRWYRWRWWRFAWSWNRGECGDGVGRWRHVVGGVFLLVHRWTRREQDAMVAEDCARIARDLDAGHVAHVIERRWCAR